LRRPVRWSAPLALLALAPKCLLCLAGYAGIGAALGLGGPELCGATGGSPGAWVMALALPGMGLAGVAVWMAIRRRHARSM
jgi:hypothetical protein